MRLPGDLPPLHVTRARGIIMMHGRQKSDAKTKKKKKEREERRENEKYKQVVW